MNLFWFQDSEFLDVWRKYSSKSNIVHDRKFTLYFLARATRGVPGDTAECGVYQGASSHIILEATKGLSKRHHMFDSFEGLSEPDTVQDRPGDKRVFRWQKHDLAASVEEVREHLSDSERVEFWKGWIPERFHEVEDNAFSLVHIDVDLYHPTFESMAFFYERVNPGGIIVCDDYGFTSCPRAFKAVNDWMRDKPEEIVPLTTGQGIVIKR